MNDFPELDTPLYEDDLQIYQHYMNKAAHRHPFWVRVKHAAIALQRGLK